ncbi:MAG: hypothetical protein JWL86_4948 [Rhizobium sp.]|nr:hypothetical protein [Rhizobium sp.]
MCRFDETMCRFEWQLITPAQNVWSVAGELCMSDTAISVGGVTPQIRYATEDAGTGLAANIRSAPSKIFTLIAD